MIPLTTSSPSSIRPYFMFVVLSLIFASISNHVNAAKFYPYGNPCKADPMYYEDAADVLYDLSSFSSLYIKYEGCAYSLRTDILSDDANSGEETWYLGFNYKQGTNVAYSLYGIKNDSNSWRKCTKGTFIGSFYSLDGLYSFAYAAGIDYSNSTYYISDEGERKLPEEDREHEHHETSYGLYCNEENQIVNAMFKDRSTNPTYYYSTIDSLTDLNVALADVSCMQIYDSEKEIDYATDLLTNSDTCSIFDGTQCPDRHGKLAACEKKFEQDEIMIQNSFQQPKSLSTSQYCYLIGSIFYLTATFLICNKLRVKRQFIFAYEPSQQMIKRWMLMKTLFGIFFMFFFLIVIFLIAMGYIFLV